ncbi:MAG: hypothetical protein WBG73_17725 [Coleofasciculaceae cyanobacterium]
MNSQEDHANLLIDINQHRKLENNQAMGIIDAMSPIYAQHSKNFSLHRFIKWQTTNRKKGGSQT